MSFKSLCTSQTLNIEHEYRYTVWREARTHGRGDWSTLGWSDDFLIPWEIFLGAELSKKLSSVNGQITDKLNLFMVVMETLENKNLENKYPVWVFQEITKVKKAHLSHGCTRKIAKVEERK